MSIIAKFFPNGEFSHGVDTSKQRRDKKRRDEPYKPPLNKERRDEYLQWQKRFPKTLLNWAVHTIGSKYMSKNLHTYTLRESFKTHCILEWSDLRGKVYRTTCRENIVDVCFHWALAPLVHQTVESCEKPESRKKLESMTKPMARNIRNAVYLMEQEKGGKDVLSFLTLTLPNLSSKGLEDCCKNWDYMIKRFIDWLRTRLEACNIDVRYVYCTEIQTKRLEKRHEYAPHLHIVFRGRNGKKKPWAISPRQARKAWKRCIASVVSEQFSDVALENLQRIRHSAARYLSKYLSKGKCCVPNDTQGDTIGHLKTQWGGMSRVLSRRIKQFTTRIGGDFQQSRMVLDIISSMESYIRQGLVSYYKAGFITLGIDKTTGLEYGLHVGCGCLRVPSYQGGLIPIVEAWYRDFG